MPRILRDNEISTMPSRVFYTTEEVADRWLCSETYVRRLINNGTLGAYKIGKGYRIASADLAAYENKTMCKSRARIC